MLFPSQQLDGPLGIYLKTCYEVLNRIKLHENAFWEEIPDSTAYIVELADQILLLSREQREYLLKGLEKRYADYMASDADYDGLRQEGRDVMQTMYQMAQNTIRERLPAIEDQLDPKAVEEIYYLCELDNWSYLDLAHPYGDSMNFVHGALQFARNIDYARPQCYRDQFKKSAQIILESGPDTRVVQIEAILAWMNKLRENIAPQLKIAETIHMQVYGKKIEEYPRPTKNQIKEWLGF